MDARLNKLWWTLRLTYGLVPIIAGADKFTNLLTHWTQYLSPLATRIVPVTPSTFMHLAGVIEIIAGILVLTTRSRYAAFLVSAWLAAIAFNLLTTGHFLDVAVRDLVMAIGAFGLGVLSAVREGAPAESRSRSLAGVHQPA